MFRLIYRQRRRILFSAFFITLGLMIMVFTMHDLTDLGFAPWIAASAMALTALIVLLCAAAAIAVAIVLLPRWRNLWEQVSVFLLINAALTVALPGLYEVPVLGMLMPFLILVAVVSIMYGQVLDRFRFWVDHKDVRRFRSDKSAEELWALLLPDPDNLDRHWDPLIHRMDPVSGDAGSFEVEYQMGYSTYEHQTITFLERAYPQHFRYHHVGEIDPKNRSLVEGIYDVRIEPLEDGPGCQVVMTAQRYALLPRAGLILWFDDELGSRTDFLRARETGRRDWSTVGQVRRDILALS